MSRFHSKKAPPAGRATGPGRRTSRTVIAGFGLAGLSILLWTCRGAGWGVPAADDYDYLYALRFERPPDLLGPMQSLWYWRPVGRQLYYAVFQGLFFTAPWLVALIHAAALLALYVATYRLARRAFVPAVAASIAVFPLLAEPSRALVTWPTAAQPLFAMLFVTLALDAALARRGLVAAAALLAALLCHEQALLGAPFAVAFAWHSGRNARERVRAVVPLALALGAWAAGRVAAFGHGAGLPPRGSLGPAIAALPSIVSRSLAAQFDVLTLEGGVRVALLVAYAVIALAAIGFAWRGVRHGGTRVPGARRGVALGGLWFALGILPLAFAADLWNPRHSSLPSLGLAFLAAGAVGLAAPRLALILSVVRAAALLAQPIVPAGVPESISAATTPLSYLHVARMQRTVDSAREVLTAAHPHLPHHAVVRYWSLPRETQIAFAGPRALRTWYADSTLTWEFWERAEMDTAPPAAAVLGFNIGVARPAVLMQPGAVAGYQSALRAWLAGDLPRADRAFGEAIAAQSPPVSNFTSEANRLRGRIALGMGQVARADSLNELERATSGYSASYWSLHAQVRLALGDRAGAEDAAARALALRPGDFEATGVMNALRAPAPPSAPAPESPSRR